MKGTRQGNRAAIVGRPPTTHQPSITFSFIQKQKVVFDLLNCELMKLIEWLPAHTSIPSLILIWFHSHSIKINQWFHSNYKNKVLYTNYYLKQAKSMCTMYCYNISLINQREEKQQNEMKPINGMFGWVKWCCCLLSAAPFIKKWMIHFFNYGMIGYRFPAQLSIATTLLSLTH